MASVLDLAGCADRHVADYVNPAGRRAFAAYDRIGSAAALEPVDLLAPALLDAPVLGREVIAMYRADGPYRRLREAMEAVVADPTAAKARFEEQDLDADSGPWALVRAALSASNDTPNVKASKVTKILHRKRPQLVPIFDSKVGGFYGVTARRPWHLWPILQEELRVHGGWLRGLAAPYRTSDGREVSTLRVLDIVVWEHAQGCWA